MGWLLVSAAGAWLWDGPWLVITVALQMVLRLGYPYWWGWALVGEWGVAAAGDWAFHLWLPEPPAARSPSRLLRESWVLLWLALLLSPILGIVAWQGTVGFDAAKRMQGFGRDVRQIVVVRAVKSISVVLLVIIIARLRP